MQFIKRRDKWKEFQDAGALIPRMLTDISGKWESMVC
jgi:hypothetical protein